MKSKKIPKELKRRFLPQNHSRLQQGLIHYYYGDGKGKTTTLIGLIVRALGHGLKPILIQFLKRHDENENRNGYFIGEINFLKGLIPIKQFGSGNFITSNNKSRTSEKKIAREGLEFMRKTISDGIYDLIALDEVINLVALDFIKLEELIDLLESKPKHMEVICTGAMFYKKLKAISQYVIQFNCLQHPYYEGIEARRGIEF